MDNIKNMSKEELYEYLLPKLLEVYNSYLFLLFDSNKLKNTFIELLYERRYEINQNNIKEIIDEEFQKITLDLVSKDNFDIINNYTKVYNIKNKSLKNIINYLKNFDDFLKFIEVFDNEEIMFKIIKDNEVINSLLKIIVNDIVSNPKYRYLKNNPKLESLISIYCMINNIELEEEEIPDTIEDTGYNIKSLFGVKGLDTEKLYIINTKRIPILTYQEQLELGKRKEKGDREALDKLVKHNLRLAYSITLKYLDRGVEKEDLIQEANLGLYKAALKYNPNLGYKFSTYATWWIRAAIEKYIALNSRTIKIPLHIENQRLEYQKFKRIFEDKLGRTPTLYEMHEEYNMDYDYITLMENLSKSLVSLDTNVKDGESEDTPLSYFIEDKNIKDFSNFNDFKDIMKDANLTDREIEILIKRYQDKLTYQEIANLLKLTKQRVEVIDKTALKKILDLSDKNLELEPYLEEFGIEKSNYILYQDAFKSLTKKIKICNNNSKLSNIIKDLKLEPKEYLYFILKYAFKMDEIDIVKYNCIKKNTYYGAKANLNKKINDYSNKDLLLKYMNNSEVIIEELELSDIYKEYININEEIFNKSDIIEKIKIRVSYYFNNINESRFIYILKESKLPLNLIILLLIKYVFNLEDEILLTKYSLKEIKYKETNIKSLLNKSLYKDEIESYLNNKDSLIEELNLTCIKDDNKKLIK